MLDTAINLVISVIVICLGVALGIKFQKKLDKVVEKGREHIEKAKADIKDLKEEKVKA